MVPFPDDILTTVEMYRTKLPLPTLTLEMDVGKSRGSWKQQHPNHLHLRCCVVTASLRFKLLLLQQGQCRFQLSHGGQVAAPALALELLCHGCLSMTEGAPREGGQIWLWTQKWCRK